jgi:hypothetical protein
VILNYSKKTYRNTAGDYELGSCELFQELCAFELFEKLGWNTPGDFELGVCELFQDIIPEYTWRFLIGCL